MLRLLAGVVAVKQRPALQHLSPRKALPERLLKPVQAGDNLFATGDVVRGGLQFSVDQIPAAPLLIPRRQPAVIERHTTAVLLLCQLRPAQQQQRVAGQLFTTHTGKSRIELTEDPLTLRLCAALQALAGGIIQQGISVLEEELPPLLLVLRIHWPLNLTQGWQLAQWFKPVLPHSAALPFGRADQPHQLAVEPLAETARQCIGHALQLLPGQQGQHAAVYLTARQQPEQRRHQQETNQQPDEGQLAMKFNRQNVPARQPSAPQVGCAG